MDKMDKNFNWFKMRMLVKMVLIEVLQNKDFFYTFVLES